VLLLCCIMLQLAIDELQLHGQITAEDFLKQREEQLDALFPTAELMPGEDCASLGGSMRCVRSRAA
jgi:hypothetical protein